jgi:hypothetical protein
MKPEPQEAPDPATSYERAKPAKQSLEGKLTKSGTNKVKGPDSQQEQDKSPSDPKAARS